MQLFLLTKPITPNSATQAVPEEKRSDMFLLYIKKVINTHGKARGMVVWCGVGWGGRSVGGVAS